MGQSCFMVITFAIALVIFGTSLLLLVPKVEEHRNWGKHSSCFFFV